MMERDNRDMVEEKVEEKTEKNVEEKDVVEEKDTTVKEVGIGFLILLLSYGGFVGFMQFNEDLAVIYGIFALVISGIIAVRSFRRDQKVIGLFALIVLVPVMFIMLVFGACA